MKSSNRLYPFPVLNNGDDYKDSSSFNTTADVLVINQKNGATALELQLKSELKDDVLEQLLKDKQVSYVYVIECSQTAKRFQIESTDTEIVYRIDEKDINGKVDISPFIVATENIKGYTNPNFNEDYDGSAFNIEKGWRLGIDNPITVTVEKDTRSLANTSSIFSIVCNRNEDENEMQVDWDNAKIIIKLPEEDYFKYKNANSITNCIAILNSMTILPALMYVLDGIANDDIDVVEEREWFEPLNRAVEEAIQIGLLDDGFKDTNRLVLAQKIINNPISLGLNDLKLLCTTEYEEDDE